MSSSDGVMTTAHRRGGMRGLGFSNGSPLAFSLVKLLAASILHPTFSYAVPLALRSVRVFEEEEPPKSADNPDLWVYLGTAIALVLLGGAFAGLTIALMGQDEIYLQVIATSGEGSEKRDAKKVLRLLKRGKHWVLVTLLLSNVITNETLPIVLDRSLGGGWPAVVSSTVLIVIFGEIAPQSVCVRYGLTIGAWMAPFVLALMWLMAPVAWPTAKLLDWLLGEDHGTTYKKAGLKTLVTLHKSLGQSPTERLNEDEVTIISAVLDLKEKAIGDIMTPMDDVFTMSADTVLDEAMMDTILTQGYSRIPIYHPENPQNFIGMLLVKILITYDPEDALRVRDFALATLPETAAETSCLDIVNFFQEGKSHMVLVSESPGQDHGALGVVTLEDVIEELIGEEIIDESDVFIDVHRAIRRITPAPRTKLSKQNFGKDIKDVQESEVEASDAERVARVGGRSRQSSTNEAPRETTFLLRRRSSAGSGAKAGPMTMRGSTSELKQHLKHLGPSNVASRPKATKYTSVKIKPGVGTIHEGAPAQPEGITPIEERPQEDMSAVNGTSAGNNDTAESDAKDGVITTAQGYGAMDMNPPIHIETEADLQEHIEAEATPASPPKTAAEASEQARQNASRPPSRGNELDRNQSLTVPGDKHVRSNSHNSHVSHASNAQSRRSSASSTSTIGSLHGAERRPSKNRRTARSGSITESLVHIGGVKKVVLETHSSSDNEGENGSSGSNHADSNGHDSQHHHHDGQENGQEEQQGSSKPKSKKSKKKRGKKKTGGAKNGETSPLLG